MSANFISPVFELTAENDVRIHVDNSDSKYSGIAFAGIKKTLTSLSAKLAELGAGNVVVVQGLPADLCTMVTLATWHSGNIVAVIDEQMSTVKQQQLVGMLDPVLYLSNHQPQMILAEKVKFFNLAEDLSAQDFEDWIAATEPCSGRNSYTWHDRQCALVLFTSGSTGIPKGVKHSLQNLLISAQLFASQFAITGQDHIMNMAPIHTMSGFRCTIILPLLSNCHCNLDPIEGNLSTVVDTLSEANYSVLILGPNLIETLAPVCDRIAGFENIRLILCTGAKLSRQTRELVWSKLATPIVDYYGLTETCGIVIAESTQNYDPSSNYLGRACGDVKLRVVSNAGRESQWGEGQLRVYSKTIFLGYWGLPCQNVAYFDTKDRVTITNDGQVQLLGRMDRSLKNESTLWLHPEAVESWFEHSGVIKDYAISTTNNMLNIYVVLQDNSNLDVVKKQMIDDLGTEYQSSRWMATTTIPRTNLGKIIWDTLNHE